MINLGSGDDTMITAGVNVASDFDIKMGAGEDGMFAISSIFAAGLSLNGGSSADILVDKADGGTTGSVDFGTGLIASRLESHTSVPGIDWLNARAEHLQRTGADKALTDFLNVI